MMQQPTKFRWGTIILCCIVSLILLGGIVCAQPSVSIVLVSPNVRGAEVRIGKNIREIMLAAKSEVTEGMPIWRLEGPGHFDGDARGLSSIYVLPDSLSQPSMPVRIIVMLSGMRIQ